MPTRADATASSERLVERVHEVAERLQGLPGGPGYVGSDLSVVHRGLSRIQAEGLARGPMFCDWGSGLGGVCAVAALNGFRPFGIEIQGGLVESARTLAADLGLPLSFVEGTFLLPGDENLVIGTAHTQPAFDAVAWDALDLVPGDCDVVFAYPWPGEEALVDGVFARHASPGALLLTFHDRDYLLLQRKRLHDRELEPLGWI